MKILVTGGAGFIGSNIANTLSRDKNATVIAFDDLSLGRPTNLSRDVKFVKGSIMDFESTLEVGRRCDNSILRQKAPPQCLKMTREKESI